MPGLAKSRATLSLITNVVVAARPPKPLDKGSAQRSRWSKGKEPAIKRPKKHSITEILPEVKEKKPSMAKTGRKTTSGGAPEA